MSELRYERRPARGAPRGALVLFHGRGADKHDLVPLLAALDPDGELEGITPRGPLSLPPGGAHWYVVRALGYPDPATFGPTFARAAAFVDALPELTGVPLERTVLGGFSQGAVMAYALSLAAGRPSPAAVVALSGFMPTVEGLELDLERGDLPVAIGHGTLDGVIGVEWGRDARARLAAAGLDVTYRESAMGHAIDPRFLAALVPWVAAAVARRVSS